MKIDTIVKTKIQNLEKNLFNWTTQSHFCSEDKDVNINNDDHTIFKYVSLKLKSQQ